MDFIYALILGVVEGITEYLPISSTGHLIVAASLFGFPTPQLSVGDPKIFRDTFEIFIQLGAVIAVLVFYRNQLVAQARRLPSDRETQRFWLNVIAAFVPAGAIGFVLRDWITETLFRPVVVGIALIAGGVVFLLIERGQRQARTLQPEKVTFGQALFIGAAQILALIPGVSRSGASIIGGLLIGLDRPTATAFSFYLAIPTLGSATIYQLFTALRDGHVVAAQLPVFGVGTVAAFVVALVAISWLLRYVSHNDFKAFGVYRILAGAIIVALALFTTVLSN